jgi:demethylmenaquinone methyltransferase/2-methoxy-6-polyprenyl-1,4-benzoquinol methylase
MDNRYVEGSSSPLSRRDGAGNTYQTRRLDDGSTHEVLKNFPSARDLRERLGAETRVTEYEYDWVASYRIMAA